MADEHPSQVIGIFEGQEQAAEAVEALLRANFTVPQLFLITRNWRGADLPGPHVDLQHLAATGATRGAYAGAVVGALMGVVASFIPGIEFSALFLAVLVGAGGAALGGYFGPFIALGWTESEAHKHRRQVELGRTVVIVRTLNRQAEAQTILVAHGAYDRSMATSP